MSVQTRSRSDKNIADAKLERTSLSADVFKRSDQTYLSSAGWKSRKRVCVGIYHVHNDNSIVSEFRNHLTSSIYKTVLIFSIKSSVIYFIEGT